MTFRTEWKLAARAAGITLPEHLLAVEGRRSSHLELNFRSEPMKDWASASLMADGPFEDSYIEEKYGLPPGSVRNVWARFISLRTDSIPEKEFLARYPEVPLPRRYEFVLLHEIGHVVRGSREVLADEYAFTHSLIVEDAEARKMRSVWYAKIPDPTALLTKL